MAQFQLEAPYQAAGDQPEAIEQISSAFADGEQYQTLLGVTGSGKTFTMANTILRLGKPTLVISHNKTLAAQLYQEFKAFFPHNAVEYFVSYYDYYQPEAYIASSDTYIEKDSSINDEIEKLRLRTTASLLSREDTIVVASVSCIYGLGRPDSWRAMMVEVQVGANLNRSDFLRSLVNIHYSRNDMELKRGSFRVRGDVIEIRPAYDDFAYRFELFGDEVERISRIHLLTGEDQGETDKAILYPARHFVSEESDTERVIRSIKEELNEQLKLFTSQGKLLEAQRLNSRTQYDMEMIQEVGYCPGIENYSRIIENRAPGTRPSTLMDFFGKDYLLIVDESHVSIPQIGAMHAGDRSRKTSLVEHGFRLPCALDNRPLTFNEFEQLVAPQTLFVSATPAQYELAKCNGVIVEQVIRPTGLLDPEVVVKPTKGQIDDLLNEARLCIERGDRVLITTLTKRMAEDLTEYLQTNGQKVQYMHSDTDTLKRSEIVRQLRAGEIDILVGINLLREGLDLPEVSLVTILDADKEGFLRSRRSLIQTIGRAARNVNGRVILYADVITDSMRAAMEETSDRRRKQETYNLENNQVPRSVQRMIHTQLQILPELESSYSMVAEASIAYETDSVETLQAAMEAAAKNLEFEKAAVLRDRIQQILSGGV